MLKFDAYFVLADWLEMPNLATRAGAYMSDVFLSVVLRLRREVLPGPGEASILGIYGVLSLIYRLILTYGYCPDCVTLVLCNRHTLWRFGPS